MTSQTRDRWNLFLCSFTILFVELMCIRWIPAYVRALGFFTNFVLLGSFLGIGLGILQARRRVDLVVFFPVTLAILVGVITLFKIELSVSSPQEVFYGVVVARLRAVLRAATSVRGRDPPLHPARARTWAGSSPRSGPH